MCRHHTRLACACAFCVPTVAAAAVPYSYTMIAHTRYGGFASLTPQPSISPTGVVVAHGWVDSTINAIFSGSGGLLTQVAANVPLIGGFTSFSGNFSINSSGQVAFFATTTDTYGIFRVGLGAPVRIATHADGFDGFTPYPDINSAGTVTVDASKGGERGLFLGDGTPPITIYHASDGHGISTFYNPAINDAGDLSFNGVHGASIGLYRGSGGPISTMVETPPDDFSSFNPHDMNDGGAITFYSTRFSAPPGIFTSTTPESFTTVADTSGPYSAFHGLPTFAGAAPAFYASLDAGAAGIFHGPDPVEDRVLVTGDTLFGSTYAGSEFGLYRFAGNSSGQIAFLATLADGSTALTRATPAGDLSRHWDDDASGDWETDAHWIGGSPDAAGLPANFTHPLTAPRTVTLHGDRTAGELSFDSPHPYTIAGTHTLTLDGGSAHGQIHVNSGHHTIAAPLAFATAPRVMIAAGSSLHIMGDSLLPISFLHVDPTAALDIASHPAAIYAPDSMVRDLLTTGHAAGAWTGLGIRSSSAAADPDHIRALGYADNSILGRSVFHGNSVSTLVILVEYTYYGDANLTGAVDADDYALIDRAIATGAPASWLNGDFNYDDLINDADYFLLDRSFLLLGGSPAPDFLATRASRFGDDYVSALLSSVPEPSLPLFSLLYSLPLLRFHPRRSRALSN